jgi:nitrite reductase/ring-hydroxylating ferredoxin subunit
MARYEIGSAASFPPGSHAVVRAGKIDVGIFNVGGTLHALPNVCPHQFGPLCAGTVSGAIACHAAGGFHWVYEQEGEIVTCPWHGIEFEIATGRCLSSSRLKVRPYPVELVDGTVVISTDRSERGVER